STAPATPAAEQAPGAKPDGRAHGHSSMHHHKHMRGHHHQHRAAMLVPGYGPLGEKSVEALKLNDSQKKLLQEARDAQTAQRGERFAAMKDKRQERVDALKAGKVDPRAALKEAEAAHKAAAE